MRDLAIIAFCSCSLVSLGAERRIREEAITVLGITAGSAQTLTEVTERLGPAKRWHTGDAAESEWKLCYRLGEGADAVFVVFASNSEMSSPKGQVNSIRIYGPQVPFAAKRRCAPLAADPSEARTQSGLRLAATQSDIFAILWPRTLSKRHSLHYDSCTKRYLEKSQPYFKYWAGKSDCGFEDPQRPYESDCASVDIQLKNGLVSFFELSRGQSIC